MKSALLFVSTYGAIMIRADKGPNKMSIINREPETAPQDELPHKIDLESMIPKGNCCAFMHTIKAKIIIAWLGISAGIMAGVVFAMDYGNWPAVTMCFASSFFALLSLHLHKAHQNGRIYTFSVNKLKCMSAAGLFAGIMSTIGMVYALVIGAVEQQTLTREGLMGPNAWIIAVWMFMTAKWAFLTCRFARKYRQEVEENQPLLAPPPVYEP